MKPVFLLCLSLASGSVLADTLYKCTDKGSESVLFTNQRVKGKTCTVISQGGSGGGGGGSKTAASATPSPKDFPKVQADTQKERDINRRTILEQEMANEMRNLEEARKANNPNKVQMHERNIASLQREMSHLK